MVYSDVQYLGKLTPSQAIAAQSAILGTTVTRNTFKFWSGLFLALTPEVVYVNGRRPIDEAFDARTLDKGEFDSTVKHLSALQAAQADKTLQMLFLEVATHLRAEHPDAIGELCSGT